MAFASVSLELDFACSSAKTGRELYVFPVLVWLHRLVRVYSLVPALRLSSNSYDAIAAKDDSLAVRPPLVLRSQSRGKPRLPAACTGGLLYERSGA